MKLSACLPFLFLAIALVIYEVTALLIDCKREAEINRKFYDWMDKR
jgi:hypothetical protein